MNGYRPSPFIQLPPSALSRGMGQVGDIITAMMARRREQERQAILDQQKEAELQFRRDQEERLTKRQEMLDTREDNRLQAQETRAQEDRRLKGYEAVGKAKPQDRAFLAQLYGGQLGQAQPDYRQDLNDPLSKNIDFLENVEEDESSPLGFSYGVNPEHERRTARAANTQTLTMPGGRPIPLPGASDEDDPYAAMEKIVALDPMHAVDLRRRLQLARAAGVEPKVALDELQEERQLAASERNARIVAGRQERAAAIASARDDERDRDASRKKLQALENRAKDADRELGIQEEIITRNNGVPIAGKDRELYDQSLKRYASAQALVESGNPESEASDPTKRAIQERAGAGRFSALGASVGLPTGANATTAKAKIAAERKALREKLASHAQTYGLPSPGMGGGQYGPVTTKTTKNGETVKVRKNLSTGQWEEVQ